MKPEVRRRLVVPRPPAVRLPSLEQDQVQERLLDLQAVNNTRNEDEADGECSGGVSHFENLAAQNHNYNHRRLGCASLSSSSSSDDDQHNQLVSTTTTKASERHHLRAPLEKLFFSVILLPFIFVFLLPSLKPLDNQTTNTKLHPDYVQRQENVDAHDDDADGGALARNLLFHETAGELLRAFVRLPLDKIRLQSGGSLVMLAEGAKTEISSKSDLQEEENEQTHMLLLQTPAEQRSSYAPAHHHLHQYGGGGGGGGAAAAIETEAQPGESHAQVNAAHTSGGGGGGSSGDYGPGGGSVDEGGRPLALVASAGQGEASVQAESASQQQALQARSDLPSVRALNVKCEKNHMTVNIVFDRPFYGMVFSKGHYNDQKCVHLPPNSGQTSVNFDIHLGKCGMSSSDAGSNGLGGGLLAAGAAGSTGLQQQQQQQPNGVFIENTIIIQYDPLVQEIYDQARKLRCTWYDYYEKSVTFRPYNVDMLDAVTANFLGDNIQCWMQIQVGKGPWMSEVAGIVKIGQTMTMVLAIKDDENRFDMLVRNCVAHDGKHQPIQLVDEYGCVARPKIMGKFQKVKNFGPAATVVSYAHFQAFKFPDSMSVHFQCVIQVCRFECPEPQCPGAGGGASAGEIGNSGGSSSGGNANSQDYATSGTEMVASGETLPPPPGHAAHHIQQQQQQQHFAATVTPSEIGAGVTSGFFNSPLSNATTSGHSRHGPASINLKLDESQGRVQVKLDTSMMAALSGNNGRPAMVTAASAAHHHQQQQHHAGPLPPHLLHMATGTAGTASDSQQGRTGHPSLGASYYRPPAVATLMAQGGATQQATTGSSGMRAHPQLVTSRAQQAPPSAQQSNNQQVLNFSPQFPVSSATTPLTASRRLAAFTSRLGDQAPASLSSLESEASSQVAGALAPYEAEYPLSLIALPRGLRLGGPDAGAHEPLNSLLHNNQRVRREVSLSTEVDEDTGTGAAAEAKARQVRQSRHLRPDSTSVQTRKTIQVVSPDDVAFSLIDPSDTDDENQNADIVNGQVARRRKHGANSASLAQSSVCFSTGRFLWGVFVTLGALLASIVIVAYVILKQRSQLEQKLSTVYVEPPPTTTRNHHLQQQQQQQQQRGNFGPSPSLSGVSSSSCPTVTMVSAGHSTTAPGQFHHQLTGSNYTDDELHQAAVLVQQQQQRVSSHKRRQQEEIQQRNNYLSRLYSQFAPATYWR